MHQPGGAQEAGAYDDQHEHDRRRLRPHHPWRAFRDLVHVRLRWAPLPAGVDGWTDHATLTVTLDPRLTQAERRCTIAHETQHLLRGPVPAQQQAREERICNHNAARLLLPDIRAVGDALAWANLRIAEAADELWVDEETLRARLDALHPSERAYLRRRLQPDDDA